MYHAANVRFSRKGGINEKIIILMVFIVLLVGCGREISVEGNGEKQSMFIEVEYAYPWKVVYHKTTRVMYAVSYGAHNCGTLTLLVNPDGSPMIFESNNK